MSKPPWRVISSSYLIDNRFLRLRSDTIELDDGTIVPEYYVRESRGFVVIFAVTESGEAVLVRQYKHGIAQELLELPAGAIDPGELPLQAAVRELAEETGFTAPVLEPVRSFIVDPTSADTVAHLFLARGAHRSAEPTPDRTENIEVRLAALDDLRAMVRDGTIDSMPHVAAIYLVLDVLGRL